MVHTHFSMCMYHYVMLLLDFNPDPESCSLFGQGGVINCVSPGVPNLSYWNDRFREKVSAWQNYKHFVELWAKTLSERFISTSCFFH